jgi:hypothetical protein
MTAPIANSKEYLLEKRVDSVLKLMTLEEKNWTTQSI